MKHLLLIIFLLNSSSVIAQQAKREIRKMKQIYFKQPVLVLFHLSYPVNNAEYRLIIEESMIPQLDTLTFRGMLNNPSFYFAKTFTNSVPGNPRRKYYLSTPDTPDGIDHFKSIRFPYERLEQPRKGEIYTRKEPAKSYNTWLVRKSSSDMGYDDKINTSPEVDSVRIAYVINVRERWKRSPSSSYVK